MSKGKFIVIEGIDGSGKSTLVNNLVEYFRTRKPPFRVAQLFEPTLDSPSAEAIQRALKTPPPEIERDNYEGDEPKGPEFQIAEFKVDQAKGNAAEGTAAAKTDGLNKKINPTKLNDTQTSSQKTLQLLRLFNEDRLWHLENRIRPAVRDHDLTILDRYFFSTAAYQGEGVNESREILQSNLRDPRIDQPDLVILLSINPQRALERLQSRGKKIEVFEKLESLNRIAQNYAALFEEAPWEFPSHIVDASQKPDAVLADVIRHVCETL